MDNKNECKYDIEGLSKELGVPVEGLRELYNTYLTELDDQIRTMYELEKAKDWYMLERVIHNVKGMSATVFVYDVQQEATAFDNLLKNNISENAHKYIENIDKMAKDAKEEIIRFFRNQEKFDIKE